MSQGPVSLAFLTPAVQQALSQFESPMEIEVQDTVLSWGGWDRAVDILIKNVTLRQPGERPAIVLPEVSVGLSIRALGRGLIAPTSLEISSPEILVQRDADGRFSFGLSAQDLEAGDNETPVSMSVLDAFMRPPDPDSRLAYLTKVGILNATVTVSDQVAGLTWRMPQSNIILVREGNELRGNVSSILTAVGQETPISAVMLRSLDTRAMSFTLSFEELDPALVARAIPEASFLKDVQTSLTGSVKASLLLDGRPRDAEINLRGDFGRMVLNLDLDEETPVLTAGLKLFDVDTKRLAAISPLLADLKPLATRLDGTAALTTTTAGDIIAADFAVTGGQGELDLSDFDIEPLALRGLALSGRVDADLMSIVLEEARVDFLEETSLAVRGAAVKDGNAYAVDLAGDVTSFSANALELLWPETIKGGARSWVLPNIPKALVPSATIEVRGRVPLDDPAAIELDQFGGSMEIRDATVHYFRPLPPVVGISGRAEFGPGYFNITTEGGQVGKNIKLGAGRVDLTELDTLENASVSVALETPLRDALQLLDQKPLGLITKLDIDPNDLAGEGNVETSFKFRLLNSLKADDVIYAARASMRNVSMKNAPLDSTISNGVLNLDLNTSGMTISGNAEMNGEPVLIDWQENFKDTQDLRSRYDVTGIVDDEFLRGVGIDFDPYIKGSAKIDLTYQSFRRHPAMLDIAAEVTESVITADVLNWAKPKGVPGDLSLRMVFLPEGGARLEDVVLKTDELDGTGTVLLGQDFSTIMRVDIDHLSYRGNDAKGVIKRRTDGGLSIDAEGKRFDINHFLEPDRGDPTEEEPGLPFDLMASFDEIVAGAQRRLQDVAVTMAHDGDDVLALRLDARVSDGSALLIRLEPAGPGQTLNVSADNAGAALDAFNWTNRIRGGQLSVQAQRKTLDAPMTGTVLVEDFSLSNAPAIAKLLEFMSLTGILSAFSEAGLAFDEMAANFSFDDGFLEFEDARAYGSSIGITGTGHIDTDAEFVAVEGTVVPAYSVNRVLGAIPLIGPLVVGGEGQGLFAANYKIDGPLEDPEVAVNPLSALAPSFLRRLFKADTEPVEPLDTGRDDSGGTTGPAIGGN
ncbi:AsmA-like C-terminal domain-containing protein [Hwanghaeella grinnelliae]|uniref:YhdP family protein n=1 Tax=Hwanghaeella grinnelliae TaxID=2500179 RepID=UPI0012372E07|nr:AsmA-like C-terminal domain-containing protein [Hwanghaeella grinnelliae]